MKEAEAAYATAKCRMKEQEAAEGRAAADAQLQRTRDAEAAAARWDALARRVDATIADARDARHQLQASAAERKRSEEAEATDGKLQTTATVAANEPDHNIVVGALQAVRSPSGVVTPYEGHTAASAGSPQLARVEAEAAYACARAELHAMAAAAERHKACGQLAAAEAALREASKWRTQSEAAQRDMRRAEALLEAMEQSVSRQAAVVDASWRGAGARATHAAAVAEAEAVFAATRGQLAQQQQQRQHQQHQQSHGGPTGGGGRENDGEVSVTATAATEEAAVWYAHAVEAAGVSEQARAHAESLWERPPAMSTTGAGLAWYEDDGGSATTAAATRLAEAGSQWELRPTPLQLAESTTAVMDTAETHGSVLVHNWSQPAGQSAAQGSGPSFRGGGFVRSPTPTPQGTYKAAAEASEVVTGNNPSYTDGTLASRSTTGAVVEERTVHSLRPVTLRSPTPTPQARMPQAAAAGGEKTGGSVASHSTTGAVQGHETALMQSTRSVATRSVEDVQPIAAVLQAPVVSEWHMTQLREREEALRAREERVMIRQQEELARAEAAVAERRREVEAEAAAVRAKERELMQEELTAQQKGLQWAHEAAEAARRQAEAEAAVEKERLAAAAMAAEVATQRAAMEEQLEQLEQRATALREKQRQEAAAEAAALREETQRKQQVRRWGASHHIVPCQVWWRHKLHWANGLGLRSSCVGTHSGAVGAYAR
jgi:hypothetical protein